MAELGQVRVYTTCENSKKTMKITKKHKFRKIFKMYFLASYFSYELKNNQKYIKFIIFSLKSNRKIIKNISKIKHLRARTFHSVQKISKKYENYKKIYQIYHYF
jgi:hypothetical protein